MPGGQRARTSQKHMPISQSDYIGLACPACGARFETDAWTLVDAADRSDLAQALRDGSLNVATCPKCGVQTAAGIALLSENPALLADDAAAVVRDLADLDYANDDHDLSAALRELRVVLTHRRAGDTAPLTASLEHAPVVIEPENFEHRTQNSTITG